MAARSRTDDADCVCGHAKKDHRLIGGRNRGSCKKCTGAAYRKNCTRYKHRGMQALPIPDTKLTIICKCGHSIDEHKPGRLYGCTHSFSEDDECECTMSPQQVEAWWQRKLAQAERARQTAKSENACANCGHDKQEHFDVYREGKLQKYQECQGTVLCANHGSERSEVSCDCTLYKSRTVIGHNEVSPRFRAIEHEPAAPKQAYQDNVKCVCGHSYKSHHVRAGEGVNALCPETCCQIACCVCINFEPALGWQTMPIEQGNVYDRCAGCGHRRDEHREGIACTKQYTGGGKCSCDQFHERVENQPSNPKTQNQKVEDRKAIGVGVVDKHWNYAQNRAHETHQAMALAEAAHSVEGHVLALVLPDKHVTRTFRCIKEGCDRTVLVTMMKATQTDVVAKWEVALCYETNLPMRTEHTQESDDNDDD